MDGKFFGNGRGAALEERLGLEDFDGNGWSPRPFGVGEAPVLAPAAAAVDPPAGDALPQFNFILGRPIRRIGVVPDERQNTMQRQWTMR
jgi:hypothetical protein